MEAGSQLMQIAGQRRHADHRHTTLLRLGKMLCLQQHRHCTSQNGGFNKATSIMLTATQGNKQVTITDPATVEA